MAKNSGTVGKKSLYIPSLDGIRAIAIITVLLSHTGYEDYIPGRAGVTIFFFLSGYLITRLLLLENTKNGYIDIGKFFARRAVRILPPILIILPLVYLLAGLDFVPGGVSWESFLAQFFYFANYFEIATDGSQAKPAGTIILWSLAIEEHFYLLYPLMFVPFLKKFSYKKIIYIFVGLCVASLLWRYFLSIQDGFIEDRTAFGTDTRFDSILFGCILAMTGLTDRTENINPKKSRFMVGVF